MCNFYVLVRRSRSEGEVRRPRFRRGMKPKNVFFEERFLFVSKSKYDSSFYQYMFSLPTNASGKSISRKPWRHKLHTLLCFVWNKYVNWKLYSNSGKNNHFFVKPSRYSERWRPFLHNRNLKIPNNIFLAYFPANILKNIATITIHVYGWDYGCLCGVEYVKFLSFRHWHAMLHREDIYYLN